MEAIVNNSRTALGAALLVLVAIAAYFIFAPADNVTPSPTPPGDVPQTTKPK